MNINFTDYFSTVIVRRELLGCYKQHSVDYVLNHSSGMTTTFPTWYMIFGHYVFMETSRKILGECAIIYICNVLFTANGGRNKASRIRRGWSNVQAYEILNARNLNVNNKGLTFSIRLIPIILMVRIVDLFSVVGNTRGYSKWIVAAYPATFYNYLSC